MSSVRSGRFLGILGEWVLLLTLWVIFAGSVSVAELAIGAVAAAVGTALSRAARATRLAAFRPHPAWMVAAVRLPGPVIRDALLLVGALLRRFAGRFTDGALHEVPFDATGSDPASASYRALVTTFTSLPPNSLVLDLNLDRGVAVVHRLVATSERPALMLPRSRE